jgi:outer membrane protein assembly factor BamB
MKHEHKSQTAFQVAVIAGIFTVVVAILLLINYLNISAYNPVENSALDALVKRLGSEPNNQELIHEIRQLDLLARKAYFTGQWQLNAGAWLMLIGAVVSAIATRIWLGLNAKIEMPDAVAVKPNVARFITQKWVGFTALLLVVLALLASYASVNYLNRFEVAIVQQTSTHSPNDVQVVNVVASNSQEILRDSGQSVVNESVAADANLPQSNTANSIDDTKTVQTKSAEPVSEQKMVAEKPRPESYPSLEQLRKQYPAFRGVRSQGISFAKNLPLEWSVSDGKNIRWKIDLPLAGYNSPVIWEEQLFLTGADNSKRMVYCYNRTTGQLLWQHAVDNIAGSPAKPPKVTDDTGLAAPTVTTDGNRVYAIFGTGDMVALKMDGTRIWAKNLGVPDNHYGHSSSLLCHNEKVFIQYDTNKGGRVLAVNGKDGSVIWDKSRKSKISWASPVLAELNGVLQLVLSATPQVAGYDAETGAELWSVDCMSGEVGPSVAVGSGYVFAGNEYATLAAIDPKTSSIVWENNEYLPEVSSPVHYNGLLYMATTYGVLACYDALSGEKVWEHEVNAGFYGSPVIADNHLFIIDMEGNVQVFSTGRDGKLVQTNAMDEHMTSTPAFMDGAIYIRGNKTLYCITK